MTDNAVMDLDKFRALLERFDVFASPAGIHGMLTGLLCGGREPGKDDWLNVVADFYNEGQTLHKDVAAALELMFRQIFEALSDESLPFRPLLPNDDESLSLRSEGLTDWTQGFLLGVGVNANVLADASEEVDEAIKDFAEIAKLSTDVEDDEENELAYSELFEYVRISTIMCFSDLARGRGGNQQVTLH